MRNDVYFGAFKPVVLPQYHIALRAQVSCRVVFTQLPGAEVLAYLRSHIYLVLCRQLRLLHNLAYMKSMKEVIEGFASQLRHTGSFSETASTAFSGRKYNNVVIAGMGGSGIVGNIIQTYVADKLEVPLLINKGYNIPAFVGPDTLFIACSFSGNTEEIISAVREAMEAEAAIGFITSDGELMRIAREHDIPLATIPKELKQPRASLGYQITELLYLLYYAGLLNDVFKTELNQSINLLQEQAGMIKVQASALANALQGKLPILYAGSAFEAVAMRFQQQLNANSKQLAHVGTFPEMNHNEVEGWQHPQELFGQVAVLCIKTAYDNPRIAARMALTRPLIERKVQTVMEVEAMGATFLEQLFYLVHLFDWASLYLAELNSEDPNINDNINYLKGEISKV